MNVSCFRYFFPGFFIFCLGVSSIDAAAAVVSPIGLWKGADAVFEMFESDGVLCAKVVALSEPMTAEGKVKTDIHNPDPSKRNAPIVGLVFMSGLTKKGDGHWESGTVYDPKCGKSYSCLMELQEPDKIRVRGFIGSAVFGRTYVWTRVETAPKPKGQEKIARGLNAGN